MNIKTVYFAENVRLTKTNTYRMNKSSISTEWFSNAKPQLEKLLVSSAKGKGRREL